MLHVRLTFLLRSRVVSDISIPMKFHFRMYGASRRMFYLRMPYIWRIKCTRDVSATYVLRSIPIRRNISIGIPLDLSIPRKRSEVMKCIGVQVSQLIYIPICGVSVLYQLLFNT